MRMSDWSSDVCSSDLKRRGMTRVKELLREGINVAFGHDCVMDPWYPLGSHDMLEVAHMGLHVGQMTGVAEQQACFAAVTGTGARVMPLDGYGLEPGCHADLVRSAGRRLGKEGGSTCRTCR